MSSEDLDLAEQRPAGSTVIVDDGADIKLARYFRERLYGGGCVGEIAGNQRARKAAIVRRAGETDDLEPLLRQPFAGGAADTPACAITSATACSINSTPRRLIR